MNVFGRTPLNLGAMQIARGQVFLIPQRCKGCNICIAFCPQQVLRESDAVNAVGYHLPEVVPGKESSCVHCAFCTMICPEFAIFTQEVAS